MRRHINTKVSKSFRQFPARNFSYNSFFPLIPDKPAILRLSSSCRMQGLLVLCSCSVDSNPTAAVTWSVNDTVPPHHYNTSVSSESHVMTATLQGRMDELLRVTCFAVNALGNDSLVLLQAGEGLDLLQRLSPDIFLMLLEEK